MTTYNVEFIEKTTAPSKIGIALMIGQKKLLWRNLTT